MEHKGEVEPLIMVYNPSFLDITPQSKQRLDLAQVHNYGALSEDWVHYSEIIMLDKLAKNYNIVRCSEH